MSGSFVCVVTHSRDAHHKFQLMYIRPTDGHGKQKKGPVTFPCWTRCFLGFLLPHLPQQLFNRRDFRRQPARHRWRMLVQRFMLIESRSTADRVAAPHRHDWSPETRAGPDAPATWLALQPVDVAASYSITDPVSSSLRRGRI